MSQQDTQALMVKTRALPDLGEGPSSLNAVEKEGPKQKGVRLPGTLPPPFSARSGPDASPGLLKEALKDKSVSIS